MVPNLIASFQLDATQRLEFRAQRLWRASDHSPSLDQVLLQALDGIAQRPMFGIVFGAIARRIIAGGMGCAAVGHQFNQRRTCAGARALRRPLRHRIDRQKVVAVDSNAGDAVSRPARRKGTLFAAGIALKGRDGPLIVDDVQNHRRLIHGSEQQGVMKIRLGAAALADPGRGQWSSPLMAAAIAQPTACGNCVARLPEMEKILFARE